MKLLLDTHVLLWSLLEPSRLKRKVLSQLQDEATELHLSAITPWEIHVLADKGRIELDDSPEQWIERALNAVPTIERPITSKIALLSRRINLPHPDPADRFLAATALVHDLTLLTADSRLLRAGVCRTLRA